MNTEVNELQLVLSGCCDLGEGMRTLSDCLRTVTSSAFSCPSEPETYSCWSPDPRKSQPLAKLLIQQDRIDSARW